MACKCRKKNISVLSIWELVVSLIVVPLFWPFPLWAFMASVQGDSMLMALAGSYMIGVPFIIFASVAMPDRYWTSEDGDSACEGTPGGN